MNASFLTVEVSNDAFIALLEAVEGSQGVVEGGGGAGVGWQLGADGADSADESLGSVAVADDEGLCRQGAGFVDVSDVGKHPGVMDLRLGTGFWCGQAGLRGGER